MRNNRLGETKNEWRKVKFWTCQHCHKYHDRDVNAAVNILNLS